ncbi:MAG TPA: hypothetical protein VLA56_20140 [Pseudomonadales bacterium]|nr:hypothetical protein [Pseudomonadales bacterium]
MTTHMQRNDRHQGPRRGPLTGRFAALILATLLAAGGAAAESPPRGGERLDRMAEALDLSADQRDRVEAILDEMHAQRQAVMASQDHGDRRAMHAAMRALGDETRGKLAEVLTPAQLQTFDELREQRRARGQGHREDRRDARFERLVDALELHSSQAGPVREIMDRSRAEARGMMARARDETLDREAVRAELDALRERTRGELAALLTPAQLEEFDALEKRMRERRESRRPWGQGRDGNR